MRPKLLVIKHGNVVMDVWCGASLSQERECRFLIFCHGLPSHPYQLNPAKVEAYINDGFVLVYPNYIGTWASDGVMSWEGCVETVLQTIALLRSGSAKSAYDGSVHHWRIKDIGLVGGSFGGSIAMVAGAKSESVNNIIAVAGPINWRDHSRIPGEMKEPISDLYHAILRGWGPVWRIPSREEWDRLVSGDADINPIDYVRELKEKNLMLIHGLDDEVVSPARSKTMHELVKEGSGKHRLMLLADTGHLGNDVIGEPTVFKEVIKFLSIEK